MNKYCLSIILYYFFYSCNNNIPNEIAAEYKALPKEIDYNFDVKPILSDKCFACHGPDKAKQKAGLRLDIEEVALAELKDSPGKYAIDPGDLDDSELVKRILSKNTKEVMPTPESHLSLSNYEKAVLVKWIKNGAEYKTHWAFKKPEKSSIPNVENDTWIKNDIDNFVLLKLESKNLKPQQEADKETLLRRVYLDVTGLPPTIKDIDNFIADKSTNSYEKVVDKLLNSNHFGEKMATDWMDLARFADSHGYTVDRVRDMSPYRDWVIKAFNKNMPYDKFIHWQLAGDLMKNPTLDMLVATAFNRNHQQNMEGGIIEEEFRAEYVTDRTNTLSTAFLGLSMECAKCHDHKYDPITQKNYYQMYSFFNNVNEAGQISWDDAMPVPTLQLPTNNQKAIVNYIQNKLTIVEQNKAIPAKIKEDYKQWIATEQYKKDMNSRPDTVGLQAHYSFENNLFNLQNKKNIGQMSREVGNGTDMPNYVSSPFGNGLSMQGDVWFDTKDMGTFHQYDPFSIALWVNIPKALKDGVIFHRGLMHLTYGFRGYHLQLKNNRLDFTLARTAPDNAITLLSKNDIPRDKWIQITATYEGSSKASGVKIFVNGLPIANSVLVDNLTKDISFFESAVAKQPALQIGAWGRGAGFKGGIVDELKIYNRVISAGEIKVLAGVSDWAGLLSKPYASLNEHERISLKDYFYLAASNKAKILRKGIANLRKMKNDNIENIQEIMVMKEMNTPRQAYVLNRGVYDAYGEKVFPNTPESILLFDKKLPQNRLGLAQWLTNTDNPLTARVAVNRYWQVFFGTGIVKTTNDFGNQGELPSHQNLLDYLAVDFLENGWNVKNLVRKITLSATYRQSSKRNKELKALDPENRLLARGPMNRLSAEMIRDNALVASGLLKNTIGGRSIKPYQPKGLWAINSDNYIPDSTDEVYKRSLYMLIKRSVPHPTMATFDASSRSICTVKRQNTNTPLQALAMMNDPIFVETCKVLGQNIVKEGNNALAISKVFRKLTGRNPIKGELEILLAAQKSAYNKFNSFPSKRESWLKAGLFKIDETLDKNWIAANTIVANTILNSEASITKR